MMAKPEPARQAEPEVKADPMRIRYLLGGHSTDADKLYGALLQRESALAERGIRLTRPRQLRRALDAAIRANREDAKPEEGSANLLDHLGGSTADDAAGEMILFGETLLGAPAQAIRGKLIYPFIAARCRQLCQAVDGHEPVFVLTLRNPATFLPTLARSVSPDDVPAFLAEIEPTALHWLHTLRRLRSQIPEVPVIAWCHEDTPVLWPDLVDWLLGVADRPSEVPAGSEAEAAAAAEAEAETGWTAYLRTLLTEDGVRQIETALSDPALRDRAARQRAVAAAIGAHGRPDAIDMDLSDTGWTQAQIDRLTKNYHADLEQIAGVDGVTLLSPWRD
jgi:hypothetical protein